MSANPNVSRRVLAAVTCATTLLFASGSFAGPHKNRVRSVDHSEVGGATKILIRGSGTPTFTVYKLDRPSRVVVDVANARLDGNEKATWQINSWAVGQVAAHSLDGNSVVRVVVGMARPGSYKVRAVGSDVLVTVTPRDAKPADASAAARARAVKARAEADRARDEAASAKRRSAAIEAKASAAAERARRQIAAAEAEAAKAAAETKRTKAQLAASRAEAVQAEQQIAAAKAEAAQARRAMNSARTKAERAVKAAKSDAAVAKQQARKTARLAKQRLAAAERKLRTAKHSLSEAKQIKADADKAHRGAQAAAAKAREREATAMAAEARAVSSKAAAKRAARAALRYENEAASVRGDHKKAVALRRRAEAAAADAEKRRLSAERAAGIADRRRAEAEKSAARAEARRKQAAAVTTAAEQRRVAAEREQARAVDQLAAVENERRDAEQRAKRAQADARTAVAVAERAKVLRVREEAAYTRAVTARKEADSRRRKSESAASELERSIKAAAAAEAEARKHRRHATAAHRAVVDKQDKAASKRAIAAARAKASRSDRARLRAEADLEARRGEVDRHTIKLARLRKERDGAATELATLRTSASKARAKREREEKQLAELVQRRVKEERELKRARQARARAATEADAEVARAAAARREASKTARASREASKTARASREASKAARLVKKRKVAARPVVKTRVRGVEFENRDRVARVVVALSRPAKPRIVAKSKKRVVMESPAASIAGDLERTLDVTRYRGPIEAVSSYRDPSDPSKVRIEVQLSKATKSELKRVGNTFHWEFTKAKSGKKTRVASKKSSKRGKRRSPVAGGYGGSSTPITQQTVAQMSRRKAKVYRGTKIDLDFKDADIHNLLRLLADVGGVNIVIPDEIKYRVTVRMRRVPWDQALEVILASKGLWYERNGNLYRIAPRKELDAQAQAEAERLRAMVQSEVPDSEYITLNYSTANEVQGNVESMLSTKGQLQVDDRTNTIVVSDIKANRRKIMDLLRRLDTPTPQIQIEARIVEARSTFVREFGVQGGGRALMSGASGNSTGLVFPNSIGIGGGADDAQTQAGGLSALPSDFAVNLPAAVGGGAGGALGFSLGSVGGNFGLNLRLSALEDQGTVRIVSAPKITVINNGQAEISQGVSIPISVVSANGVQTQFVPADLSLKVTPTVSQSDCAVTLKVEVKKNEADFVNTGARGDPTILRKEAKTTILVADGATTVIGGIYTRNTGLSYSKVPFFGDLPVFGWFFKSRKENDDRTEVLVFITPKITNKASLRCERPSAAR